MPSPQQLQILLLSESEALAALDRRALRDAGVDRVECLTSGIEAARLLARLTPPPAGFKPQAVVCSQRLADMDGEQFCAILRLHPLLLDMPLLLILPHDSEVEQLKTLGCGASALLARPYSVNALKSHLHWLLASCQGLEQLDKAGHLADTKAFDDALATYGMLLKPVRQPEDYFRVGMQCLQQRQWNNAINAFQRALHGALIQGKSELGMAAAWKGKGDMAQYRHYLNRAAATFVRARQWHRARAVYGRLQQEDPAARNPFLTEATQRMGRGEHDDAAEILAQGFELTPRKQLSEKIAQTCLAAQEPHAMLQSLEDSLERALGPEAGPLGDDIRQSLSTLARQIELRRREEAAERQWRATRQAARQREQAAQAEDNAPAHTGQTGQGGPRPQTAPQASPGAPHAAQARPVAALWDEPMAAPPARTGSEPHSDLARQPEKAPPLLAPLTEAEVNSELFSGKGGFNELLSVMKYTWKAARRHR